MRAGLAGLGMTLFLAPGLHAYPNDVDMSGLAQWQDDCDPYGSKPCSPVLEDGSKRVVPDQEAFDGLVQELGVLLAPRDVGPASTPGQKGLDVAVEVSAHRINNQHSYWARALERSARASKREPVYPAMGTAQVWIKKGLPFSLELGGGGTYLIESRIFTVGLQGKWTLNEGFFWLPDLALTGGAAKSLCMDLPSSPATTAKERGTGTTYKTCGTDLDLATVVAGAVVSKTFAFLGMVRLSPYAGYQKIFVHAVGPQIDRDETTNDRSGETFRFRDYKLWGDFVGQQCGESGSTAEDCLLDQAGGATAPQLLNLLTHRNKLYAGLNMHVWVLQAGVQGEITHVQGTRFMMDNPAFQSSNVALTGVTMPDLQWAGTFKLGLLF